MNKFSLFPIIILVMPLQTIIFLLSKALMHSMLLLVGLLVLFNLIKIKVFTSKIKDKTKKTIHHEMHVANEGAH